MAEDSGKQAHDGINDDCGGEFAAGEDEVPDGEFLVAEQLADALVYAFIAAADQHDAVERGEAAGGGLGEALALRREQDHGVFGGVAGLFGWDVEGFETLRRWAAA